MSKRDIMSQIDRVAMEAELQVAGKTAKFPGGVCTLAGIFRHKGPGEDIYIQWGLSDAGSWGRHNFDHMVWIKGTRDEGVHFLTVRNDVIATDYSFKIEAVFPEGFYSDTFDSWVMFWGPRATSFWRSGNATPWDDDVYYSPKPSFGVVSWEYS